MTSPGQHRTDLRKHMCEVVSIDAERRNVPQIIGPTANPSTYRDTPKSETVSLTLNSFDVTAMVADQTELAKVTAVVINARRMVMTLWIAVSLYICWRNDRTLMSKSKQLFGNKGAYHLRHTGRSKGLSNAATTSRSLGTSTTSFSCGPFSRLWVGVAGLSRPTDMLQPDTKHIETLKHGFLCATSRCDVDRRQSSVVMVLSPFRRTVPSQPAKCVTREISMPRQIAFIAPPSTGYRRMPMSVTDSPGCP